LAVPAVQVTASGALFESGVLLESADAIERLAEIDTVVFDKTGTLTTPAPRVSNAADIEPALLLIAARLARASRHPLAKAVAAEHPAAAPVDDAREEHGFGVAAQIGGVEARLGSAGFCGLEREAAALGALAGDTSLVCFRHGARTALLQVRQMLRADAAETLRALEARGLAVEILSGDRPEAVAQAAQALGVANWRGGVTPAEKVARLEELCAQGRRTLMVGDGLNDAPALASAHVSLSPIDAAQIAQASSDAIFLGERLRPVVDALETAARARRLMQENLALSVLYNMIAAPMAMAGLLTPLIAAAAMSGSSLIVTLNALRAGASNRRAARTDAAPTPALAPTTPGVAQ